MLFRILLFYIWEQHVAFSRNSDEIYSFRSTIYVCTIICLTPRRAYLICKCILKLLQPHNYIWINTEAGSFRCNNYAWFGHFKFISASINILTINRMISFYFTRISLKSKITFYIPQQKFWSEFDMFICVEQRLVHFFEFVEHETETFLAVGPTLLNTHLISSFLFLRLFKSNFCDWTKRCRCCETIAFAITFRIHNAIIIKLLFFVVASAFVAYRSRQRD